MVEGLNTDRDKAGTPAASFGKPDSKPTQTSQTGSLPSSPYEPIGLAFEAATSKSIKTGSQFTLIGLMSGTSFDGIDAAVLQTDGDGLITACATHFLAYTDDDRNVLSKAMEDAIAVTNPLERTGLMLKAEAIVTERHIEAIRSLIESTKLNLQDIDAIAFHGQTVIHKPHLGFTVQLGHADWIAAKFDVPVIYDLRSNDMAHGGEGAPLVPIYHKGLVRAHGWEGPVAFVNIGGVSNVSYIAGETLLSFDVGPGNALLDDWVMRHTGQRYDEGGSLAASGLVDEASLSALLNNPYFDSPAPKSLDRNAFSLTPVEALSPVDGAATLAEFTARALAESAKLLPTKPALWVISGGGAQNPFLMGRLEANIDASVMRATDLGVDGDYVEAQAFAYLGVRSLKGMPLTFPGTTGTKEPVTGGKIAIPQR